MHQKVYKSRGEKKEDLKTEMVGVTGEKYQYQVRNEAQTT